MATLPYRQIQDGIRYIVSCRQPNLFVFVGFLSRLMQNLGMEHWKALKRVIRYLQHIKDMFLTYQNFQSQNPSQVEGYLCTPLDGWIDLEC